MALNSQPPRSHKDKAAAAPKAPQSHPSRFWHRLLQSKSSKIRNPLWLFPQRVKWERGEGELPPAWPGKGFNIIHIPFSQAGGSSDSLLGQTAPWPEGNSTPKSRGGA